MRFAGRCKECGEPIARSDAGTLFHSGTGVIWCDLELFRALRRAS